MKFRYFCCCCFCRIDGSVDDDDDDDDDDMADEKYPASAPHHKVDVDQLYPSLGRPIFSDKDPDRNRYIEESDDDDVDLVDNVYGSNKDELFDAPR